MYKNDYGYKEVEKIPLCLTTKQNEIMKKVRIVGFSTVGPFREDGECFLEMRQLTPKKDEWLECLCFDGSEVGLEDSILKLCKDFNADQEVEMMLQGERKIPESIQNVLEDVAWKCSKLNKLCNLMKQVV